MTTHVDPGLATLNRSSSRRTPAPGRWAGVEADEPPMSEPGEPPPDTGPDERAEPRHRHAAKPDRLSRRRFLGWSLAGGAVVATAAAVSAEESGGGGARRLAASRTSPSTPPTTATTTTTTTTTTTSPTQAQEVVEQGVPVPVSPAIVAENARTGTAWWVVPPGASGTIEGYADHVSVQVGEVVTLHVSSSAPSFHVEAYRMGYYQGIGARLIATSPTVPGVTQPPPALIAPTNTVECSWTPSLQLTVDPTWPPGAYLLKLVGATGAHAYVPLCVRDDASESAVLVMHSVTTWQAYNRWGGYSLYYGNKGGALTYTQNPAGGTYDDRARIVSFDRPYSGDWAAGASDFIGNELPVIFHAEQLGLDVSYWTDVDLHEQPSLLANHRALFSLGHDEYWSTPMRSGVEAAIQRGLNVAFLGANACYRQIRLEPSPLGADRHVVCYKSAAEDPLDGKDDAIVTVNWEQPPVSNPESQMTGGMYQDIDADADIIVSDPSSWALIGTGLTAAQHLPKALQGEFDKYVPSGGAPTGVDIITHSLVANRAGNYSDMTWYTAPGGGGVIDVGNASWVGQMANAPLIPTNVLPAPVPGVTSYLLRIMENVYSVLGTAPASITHPSSGNWRNVYR